MKKIALITCVADKKAEPSAAANLYQGPLFESFMAVAKAENPDAIYILSGKHHLLHLDTVIEPYDLNLNDVSDDELQLWAATVIAQLQKVADLEADHFLLVASPIYLKFIAPALKHKTIPENLVF